MPFKTLSANLAAGIGYSCSLRRGISSLKTWLPVVGHYRCCLKLGYRSSYSGKELIAIIALEQVMKAQKGSRGIAQLFLQPRNWIWWVINATPRPLHHRRGDSVPIIQGTRWTPGPFWTTAEYLVATGIRSTDRTAHSEVLYWHAIPAQW